MRIKAVNELLQRRSDEIKPFLPFCAEPSFGAVLRAIDAYNTECDIVPERSMMTAFCIMRDDCIVNYKKK
ncbi:hypothetical protein HLB25_10275 [Dickeya dadantii]|uniref:hypothetical protein n=1 Tax=Dickeya dadantii TaxID=204038 RepID=UPI00149559D6|nr:hypothetical protein [Dickeya dadantii]NPE55895.1 hypothetical protein [Dickeya dadantii]NPE67119.1 hypothetical protein [Dickeya dadantii]